MSTGRLVGQICIIVLLLIQESGAPCPRLCACLNTRVTCSEGMNTFPEIMDFPRNTTDIEIGSSQISTVPFEELLFQLKELRRLDVSRSKIQTIERINPPSDSKLKILKLTFNQITHVEPGAFDSFNHIYEINLDDNPLTEFPVFNKTSSLRRLYLRYTDINRLSKVSLENLPRLEKLNLAGTAIRELPSGIFEGNSQLMELNLEDCRSLATIHDKAFVGLKSLQTLNLDNTLIRSLPERGLESVRHLSLRSVDEFWAMPDGLIRIESVAVSRYNSFLCCAFLDGRYMARQGRQQSGPGTDGVVSSTPTPQSINKTTMAVTMETTVQITTTLTRVPSTNATSSTNSVNPPTNPCTGFCLWKRDLSGFGTSAPSKATSMAPSMAPSKAPSKATSNTTPTANNNGDGWGQGDPNTSPTKDGGGGVAGGIFPTGFGSGTVIVHSTIKHETITHKPFVTNAPYDSISCTPRPDAFHPCENIMGAFWLTAVCFIVGSLAIVSNFFLLLTLMFSQRRLNVTRFLMCNLAFADLCLGLYLFILVCASIETSGEFYNYVQSWQRRGGCQVAGFLAVFSTELSVFTLLIITIERFLAIVYAMEMNTRLSYTNTVKLMIGGWLFALLTATLPLLGGVSGYDKVAICLPFDVDSTGSKIFVLSILVINGVSFLIVAALYAKMFLVVITPGDMQSAAPQRNDARVAKRMAVLVLTDFMCWAPIALFGILAAVGLPMVGVSESKFLLVFFFPLNSCCNPFLYAFFTRGFKRDFYSALSRYGFCKVRALRYSGTMSSFMYSRSRKSQTQENNTPENRIQRISTVSSSSEMRTSPRSPNATVSSATADLIPMTGVANNGFSVDSPSVEGNVFFPVSPTKTADSPNPRPSALRKTSTGQKSPKSGTTKKVVISDVNKTAIPEEQRDEKVGERQLDSRRNSTESVHGIEGVSLDVHL